MLAKSRCVRHLREDQQLLHAVFVTVTATVPEPTPGQTGEFCRVSGECINSMHSISAHHIRKAEARLCTDPSCAACSIQC